jgi:hypothetical protein
LEPVFKFLNVDLEIEETRSPIDSINLSIGIRIRKSEPGKQCLSSDFEKSRSPGTDLALHSLKAPLLGQVASIVLPTTVAIRVKASFIRIQLAPKSTNINDTRC